MTTVPEIFTPVKINSPLAVYTENLSGLPYVIHNHIPILLPTALPEQTEEFFKRIAFTRRSVKKIGDIAIAYAYNAIQDAYGARRAFVVSVVGKGAYQEVRNLASTFRDWPIEEVRTNLPSAFYRATKNCTLEEKRKYIQRWFSKEGLTVEKIKAELKPEGEVGEVVEQQTIERFKKLLVTKGIFSAVAILDTWEGMEE